MIRLGRGDFVNNSQFLGKNNTKNGDFSEVSVFTPL